ncbi:D-2-hydroxyacid dehydrogenase [Oceanospirillum linum]|uniref:Glycerate dehydrogenase n=1 Tax=Oceanospirillum linum TaxID=966 RepID=A0A1T1HEU5_OCELI|nr:D-2-hydroxyacid dehydrogenase [Oceanospirillum linum]OOV88322.1 glycerate dehydrogenase [Oceanospirillum linum]SEF52297.1 glycerate dehydrogenase [Oleiphilus messinensis]SMP04344.1 glycerate dehydrogenase [Oceanospirillum linum]
MLKKGVLLDAASLGHDIDLSELKETLGQLKIYDKTEPDQVIERIQGADVILTNKVIINASAIANADNLKLICVLATGVNNVDLEAASQAGIPVSNAVAYGTHSVAQHTLMLMLMLTTRQPLYQSAVADGEWNKSPFFCLMQHPVSELAGQHLVIVGSGELGRKVAQLAKAFEMKVSFSARPGNEADDGREPLAQLLPKADILSLHCPLTEATKNLIDAGLLSLAKPELMIINCARGGIVNEKDVLATLKAGKIGGYGTDVLTQEPPVNGNPLLDALQENLNLIITPHNAWISQHARQNIIDQTTRSIQTFTQTQ